MARTSTWNSSSDEEDATPAPTKVAAKRTTQANRGPDENVPNESTSLRRSNRTWKPSAKLGGPEAIEAAFRGSTGRSAQQRQTSTHRQTNQPTRKIAPTKQAKNPASTLEANLVRRKPRPSKRTKLLESMEAVNPPPSGEYTTSGEEDEPRPTGGRKSTQTREEDEPRPTGGGYHSSHTTSGEEDEPRPTGGGYHSSHTTSGEEDEPRPTGGGYHSSHTTSEDEDQPHLTSGPMPTTPPTPRKEDEPQPTGTSRTTSLAPLPAWLQPHTRPRSVTATHSASLRSRPKGPPGTTPTLPTTTLPGARSLPPLARRSTETRAPSTRKASDRRRDLTSANAAPRPARNPAPYHEPRPHKLPPPNASTQLRTRASQTATNSFADGQIDSLSDPYDELDEDDTYSSASDSNDSHFRINGPTNAPPGTLLYQFTIGASTRANTATTDAAHILRWLRIMKEGQGKFERAIARNLRHPTEPLALFATVNKRSTIVRVAHGFRRIVMPNSGHPANGHIGYFLGDRIAAISGQAWHLQDPSLCTIRDWASLLATYDGSPASESTITKSNAAFLSPKSNGNTHCVHRLFPIPHSWWPDFLGNQLTVIDALDYIRDATHDWSDTTTRKAAQAARLWARCACTQDYNHPESSGVTIRSTARDMDSDTLAWAREHLHSYLPPSMDQRQTPSPATTATEAPPTSRTEEIALQLSAAAHALIQSTIERADNPRQTPKELPENVLCFLLGLSGLSWDERDLLAPIWSDLYKQPNKSTREVTLQSFFDELGAQVPSFREFSNTILFDNIVNHKLAPGPTYETYHHGISILAVSLRSFNAQEQERREAMSFELATNKTPDAITKHLTKGPPPLPTTISELIQQIHRLLVLTEGLFTHRCPMADPLRDLMEALQVREHRLLSDFAGSAQLIPQVVWALTITAREFYRQVLKRNQIDPTYGNPRTTTTTLNQYTHMIKMRQKLDIDDIPTQWLIHIARHPTQEQTPPAAKAPTAKQPKPVINPPQAPSTTPTPITRINHHWPSIFANNETIKSLQGKRGRILTDIFTGAGISAGGNQLDLSGLPGNLCLRWLILGQCSGGRKDQTCTRSHPSTGLSVRAAESVFRQIEPGLKLMADKLKAQQRNE